MLASKPWALKVIHVRSMDESSRRRLIPRTNGTTPMWTVVMTLWLQDVLLVVNVSGDGPSDVADGNGEHAFPSSARCSRVSPTAHESIFGARRCCCRVVVEFGVGVSVEGGVDDILNKEY